MEKPAVPHNEKERLSELKELGLLDSEAEERFDRFTRLAKRLDATETPRDVSFCGHAILGLSLIHI